MIIRSSPIGGNFFVAIKTFDANIDSIGNFVLIVKTPSDVYLHNRRSLTAEDVGCSTITVEIHHDKAHNYHLEAVKDSADWQQMIGVLRR